METRLFYGNAVNNKKITKDIFDELKEQLEHTRGFCKQVHKTFYKNEKEISESWKDMARVDKIIDQMYLILKEIFQSIDSLETKVLYSIGDWTLINIWNIVMFDKFKMKITARPFDVKKYFGVIK